MLSVWRGRSYLRGHVFAGVVGHKYIARPSLPDHDVGDFDRALGNLFFLDQLLSVMFSPSGRRTLFLVRGSRVHTPLRSEQEGKASRCGKVGVARGNHHDDQDENSKDSCYCYVDSNNSDDDSNMKFYSNIYSNLCSVNQNPSSPVLDWNDPPLAHRHFRQTLADVVHPPEGICMQRRLPNGYPQTDAARSCGWTTMREASASSKAVEKKKSIGNVVKHGGAERKTHKAGGRGLQRDAAGWRLRCQTRYCAAIR